jgi:GMP synthase-like glutamine amidotransferase
MPSLPLRIAILECDTPLPGTVAQYGSFGGVFTSLLRAGASTLSPPLHESDLVLSAYDVVQQKYPSLDSIDAVLISGARHNSFDDDPWIVRLVDFVKQLLAQDRVRIIGVCFGHQIIGRALGVEVGRSRNGWEISVVDVDLTEKGREIFGKDKLVGIPSSFYLPPGRWTLADEERLQALFQMHRDAVKTYPPGVEALAHTDKCAVQGMYSAGRFISLQGHPEFNETIVRELLVARHGAGVFDDELFQDAMQRVGKEQDGVLVARAFLRFLLE